MGKKKLNFEEALSQLETIAERIEKGEIGLEESITEYEKGMGLLKQCREILAKAEQRIQKLQETPDGTLETTKFTRADEC